jgi:hypothetical protein
MPLFIIFIILTLVFAAIVGIKGKNDEESINVFIGIHVICVIASAICMIVIMGPNRSSDGTEMTVALNKLTGGWSDTIVVGFIFSPVLAAASAGVTALARKCTPTKEEREKNNNTQSVKKKLILPRIVIILLLGIFGITYIPDVIPDFITPLSYVIKPDSIHHVRFDNSMMLKSSGLEQTGIYYTVGLGYMAFVILIILAICIFFIISLISLIKAIKKNQEYKKAIS